MRNCFYSCILESLTEWNFLFKKGNSVENQFDKSICIFNLIIVLRKIKKMLFYKPETYLVPSP